VQAVIDGALDLLAGLHRLAQVVHDRQQTRQVAAVARQRRHPPPPPVRLAALAGPRHLYLARLVARDHRAGQVPQARMIQLGEHLALGPDRSCRSAMPLRYRRG
jgi:hypothetical protein